MKKNERFKQQMFLASWVAILVSSIGVFFTSLYLSSESHSASLFQYGDSVNIDKTSFYGAGCSTGLIRGFDPKNNKYTVKVRYVADNLVSCPGLIELKESQLTINKSVLWHKLKELKK